MSLISKTFLVLDTETTGLDPSEHRAVEVGAVVVKEGQIIGAFTTYLNPGRSIPPGASGVHGLVDSDVAEAPTLEQTLPWLNSFATGVDALVAHNAPFDRPMLPGLMAKPWLDTLRLAQRLYPEMESHKNQTLRYALGLNCPEAAGMPAHRALSDAYVTARLLVRLLNDVAGRSGAPETIEALIQEIDAPMVLTMCNFGKYKGLPWAQVPRDYLQWVVRQGDMNPDVMHTAKHYLGA